MDPGVQRDGQTGEAPGGDAVFLHKEVDRQGIAQIAQKDEGQPPQQRLPIPNEACFHVDDPAFFPIFPAGQPRRGNPAGILSQAR